jgi:drug/metabolite transporter (DMT)-like permease
MDFSRLVIAALFGYMLFSEIPSVYTAIGAALIFTSTVYIAQREARIARRQAAAAPVPD